MRQCSSACGSDWVAAPRMQGAIRNVTLGGVVPQPRLVAGVLRRWPPKNGADNRDRGAWGEAPYLVEDCRTVPTCVIVWTTPRCYIRALADYHSDPCHGWIPCRCRSAVSYTHLTLPT